MEDLSSEVTERAGEWVRVAMGGGEGWSYGRRWLIKSKLYQRLKGG